MIENIPIKMALDARIKQVKVLHGSAKGKAMRQGLKPDDLVIVTTRVKLLLLPEYHVEKIEGDPVSFLLKRCFGRDCRHVHAK